ncbi:MAG: protein kinase [Myxococcales bacterium]|nr:protein kinase [Myxococcales bacterium]
MSDSDAWIGSVLQGRYRVIERLAEGAMGVVYRGERLQLQKPVAIKFLHPGVAQQESLRRRFEVEARAMGRLAHPNCVSVLDFGVEDVPYLVMEYAHGRSLRALLQDGPMPKARALHLGRQLLTALVHAHAHGIVHRDVKPENVMVQQSAGLEDHLRVLDFGLAKMLGDTGQLTAGLTVGTPNYMAPEQTQEGAVDARVDLYAAGIVLFEMLTGRQPFAADSVGEILRRQLHMPAPLLRQVHPAAGISPALEAVVYKAMAKRPDERFEGAQQMLDALERVPELAADAASPLVDASRVAARTPPPPLPLQARLPPPPGGKAVVAPPVIAPGSGPLPSAQAARADAPSEPSAQPTIVLSDADNLAAADGTVGAHRGAFGGAVGAAWQRARLVPVKVRYGLLALLVAGLVLFVWPRERGEPTPAEAPSAAASASRARAEGERTPVPAAVKAARPSPSAQSPAPEPPSPAGTPRPARAPDRWGKVPARGAKPAREGGSLRRASDRERWGSRW